MSTLGIDITNDPPPNQQTCVFPFQHPHTSLPLTMLSRAPTKLALTVDDILAYEQRRLERESLRRREATQPNSSQSTIADVSEPEREREPVAAPTQTRAARVKAAREARMGVVPSSRR